ncbi:MAG: hypothetical protein ACR2NM_10180, partial [Bythopirellula sp.]
STYPHLNIHYQILLIQKTIELQSILNPPCVDIFYDALLTVFWDESSQKRTVRSKPLPTQLPPSLKLFSSNG